MLINVLADNIKHLGHRGAHMPEGDCELGLSMDASTEGRSAQGLDSSNSTSQTASGNSRRVSHDAASPNLAPIVQQLVNQLEFSSHGTKVCRAPDPDFVQGVRQLLVSNITQLEAHNARMRVILPRP